MNRATAIILLTTAFTAKGCSRQPAEAVASLPQPPVLLSDSQIVALNGLRNEVNETYGFKRGIPRVNCGPCGRFAKAFREHWNARFGRPVDVTFVTSPDGTQCYHVLVRLPDGSYFDGGSGVIPGPTLQKLYPEGTRLDVMEQFDLSLLDKWSYGLGREYPDCPNYSDETTAKIIERHLARVPGDVVKP